MTDLAEPASTTIAADEQLRRIQELQRKRGVGTVQQPSSSSMPEGETPTHLVPSTTRRRSRSHPAIGARVGAAGLGLVTMFGLIAGMGLAQPSTASGAPAPAAAAAAPPQVVVVIHRTATGAVPPTDVTTSIAAATPAPLSTAAAPTAPAPITLTARPVVRAAAPAQSNAAPTAKTNGSR